MTIYFVVTYSFKHIAQKRKMEIIRQLFGRKECVKKNSKVYRYFYNGRFTSSIVAKWGNGTIIIKKTILTELVDTFGDLGVLYKVETIDLNDESVQPNKPLGNKMHGDKYKILPYNEQKREIRRETAGKHITEDDPLYKEVRLGTAEELAMEMELKRRKKLQDEILKEFNFEQEKKSLASEEQLKSKRQRLQEAQIPQMIQVLPEDVDIEFED
jgi:hypothetical protein